jgi:integrase/recombinase XerD
LRDGALLPPDPEHRTGRLDRPLTPDGVYGLIQRNSASTSALMRCARRATLHHQADIAKVQEWLGHQHRYHPHQRSPQDAPKDSPTLKINTDSTLINYSRLSVFPLT